MALIAGTIKSLARETETNGRVDTRSFLCCHRVRERVQQREQWGHQLCAEP